MVRSATQFPKKCKKLFFQICKSFFFFSKLRFSLSSTMVYKSLIGNAVSRRIWLAFCVCVVCMRWEKREKEK